LRYDSVVKFEVSRNARRQIDKIQNRWTNDRPAARTLFLDELAGAEGRLRENPELGKFYAATKRGPVRRILLIETKHHVY